MDVTFSAAGLRLKVTAAQLLLCYSPRGYSDKYVGYSKMYKNVVRRLLQSANIHRHSFGTPFQVDPHIFSAYH